jgi:uncharacterized tellurite resistance protein B-like protein
MKFVVNIKWLNRMGFFEKVRNVLDSSEMKRKKSHLKNLYQIALADGMIANQEFDFLLNVCDRIYINREILQEVINFSDDIQFYVPLNTNEKIDYLYDYVRMAISDGELNELEIAHCKLFAVKYGFKPTIIDIILNELIDAIIKGIAREIIINRLLKLL